MYEKTKAFIAELMTAQVFSGASFCFMSKEQTESYCWGNAQVKPTVEPLRPELLFDVASLTKVVGTTTVILKLMEQHRLAIDQPLHTYLPEFRDQHITLRHLLTHTADIQGYIDNRDQLNAVELRQAYLQLAAGSQVGKKVVYTDTGTILLGFLLEKLYQKDVTDILTEEVLQPLEMWDSTFLPKEPLRCVPTENHPLRGLIRGKTHDPKAFILQSHAGNAGLFTNLHDLAKFVRMYLNHGSFLGKSFLKATTILSLLQDQTPLQNGHRSLGWDLIETLDEQRPMLYHTGYTGTFLIIDLLEQEAFIFLSNRVHPTDQRAAYLQKRDQLIYQYLKEKSSFINEKTSH